MSNIKRVKSNNLFDIVFMKSRADIWAAFVFSGHDVTHCYGDVHKKHCHALLRS